MKYEEELRLLTDRPETWISLDQMIQKPLASSGTTEFSSPENDDDENQISDGEPKEENGSGKKASVTPPAASEEGTITTKSKD